MAKQKINGAQLPTINRQNNGSNITEASVLTQHGWKAGQPGVAATLQITVTFPVAYTNVPTVIATFGGDTTTVTSTLGSGGANVNNAIVEAITVSTTGFVMRFVSLGGTNWAANNTVYGHWVATGV